MKHKNSHLLVGYWSRLRKGRDVPDQVDIDPRAIKRMLPYVFILDVADFSSPSYRLAGTGLCERFGCELKGSNYLFGWEAQSGQAVLEALKQALHTRQPVCLSSIGASADCGMVEMETVLAPVSFGPGVTRFIGLTQVLSDTMPLGGHPVAFQRLIATQMVHEVEPAMPHDNPPPPPHVGHPRAPYLRLVVSHNVPASSRRDSLLERMDGVLGPRPVTP